ncbi:MAG: sulfatase-like hydrolase/transferase [Proteobacteria bacterium]|nr:sulfatase-like hydrolase/transferase [Pseudomonadota bacterium]
MSYLVLFVLCVGAWLMDLVLQAVYYFGTSPFGLANIARDAGGYFAESIYYSACFFALFSLPAMVALAIDRHRHRDAELKTLMPGWIYILHASLMALLITVNHADHEIFRFMGMHYSVEMLKAYNIFSNTTAFVGDTLRTDARGAYSSVILFCVPVIYLTLCIIFRKRICIFAQNKSDKVSPRILTAIAWSGISLLVLLMMNSFIKVDDMKGLGWHPSRNQQKVAPYFIALIEDIRNSKDSQKNTADYSKISEDINRFQKSWMDEEPDKNWKFISNELPFQKTYQGQCPAALGNGQPNFVIIFVETMRAMNLPDFNPEITEDPMPFLHSLVTGDNPIMQKHAMHAAWFTRYLAAALPTIDAMMSAHTGLPAHSEFTVSSVFVSDRYPSFISLLRDHGYFTAFLDSSDGGFTNWSMWVRRWYEQFGDLMTRDDKVTIKALGDLILERRGKPEPYAITAITTSNHIPFRVPEGGIQPPEDAEATERIKYTLRYSDDQIKALFERLDQNDALSNTVFFILGDHAYSLDEVPNISGIGGNYDTLRYNVVWVPLIMLSDLDGIPRGHQGVAAAHTDIGPTVLSAAGICADNSFVGHSLLAPKPHRILVNKFGNYLYREREDTLIGIKGFRDQLYKTSDRLEKHDLWKDEPDRVERLKGEAERYRRVLDYAYEMHKIPANQ